MALRSFARLSRLPVLLRALLHPALVVLAGTVLGLALELLIQIFGSVVVPDAFDGFPAWYQVGKAVLFQLAAVLPAMLTGAMAKRHAGRLGAITAIACALAVDIAFHGAMPGAVSELVSPLGLAAGAGILGAVCGWAGASLAQRWRARRAVPAP
jgi:hypothetical protein